MSSLADPPGFWSAPSTPIPPPRVSSSNPPIALARKLRAAANAVRLLRETAGMQSGGLIIPPNLEAKLTTAADTVGTLDAQVRQGMVTPSQRAAVFELSDKLLTAAETVTSAAIDAQQRLSPQKTAAQRPLRPPRPDSRATPSRWRDEASDRQPAYGADYTPSSSTNGWRTAESLARPRSPINGTQPPRKRAVAAGSGSGGGARLPSSVAEVRQLPSADYARYKLTPSGVRPAPSTPSRPTPSRDVADAAPTSVNRSRATPALTPRARGVVGGSLWGNRPPTAAQFSSPAKALLELHGREYSNNEETKRRAAAREQARQAEAGAREKRRAASRSTLAAQRERERREERLRNAEDFDNERAARAYMRASSSVAAKEPSSSSSSSPFAPRPQQQPTRRSSPRGGISNTNANNATSSLRSTLAGVGTARERAAAEAAERQGASARADLELALRDERERAELLELKMRKLEEDQLSLSASAETEIVRLRQRVAEGERIIGERIIREDGSGSQAAPPLSAHMPPAPLPRAGGGGGGGGGYTNPRREFQLASLAEERNRALEEGARTKQALEALRKRSDHEKREAAEMIAQLEQSEAVLAAEASAAKDAAARSRENAALAAKREKAAAAVATAPPATPPKLAAPRAAEMLLAARIEQADAENEFLRQQLEAKNRELEESRLDAVAASASRQPYGPGGPDGVVALLRTEVVQLRQDLIEARATSSGGREAMQVERNALLMQSATMAESLGQSEASVARAEREKADLESAGIALRQRVAQLEGEWNARRSDALATRAEHGAYNLAAQTHASALRVIEVRKYTCTPHELLSLSLSLQASLPSR